jgi:hypothetical protein
MSGVSPSREKFIVEAWLFNRSVRETERERKRASKQYLALVQCGPHTLFMTDQQRRFVCFALCGCNLGRRFSNIVRRQRLLLLDLSKHKQNEKHKLTKPTRRNKHTHFGPPHALEMLHQQIKVPHVQRPCEDNHQHTKEANARVLHTVLVAIKPGINGSART